MTASRDMTEQEMLTKLADAMDAFRADGIRPDEWLLTEWADRLRTLALRSAPEQTLVMLDGTPLLEYLADAAPEDTPMDAWTQGYEECKRRLYKILAPQLAAAPEQTAPVAWLDPNVIENLKRDSPLQATLYDRTLERSSRALAERQTAKTIEHLDTPFANLHIIHATFPAEEVVPVAVARALERTCNELRRQLAEAAAK